MKTAPTITETPDAFIVNGITVPKMKKDNKTYITLLSSKPLAQRYFSI